MKKYISIILFLIFSLSLVNSESFARPLIPEPIFNFGTVIPENRYAKDDQVTFIVEVEGDPVLSGKEAAAIGTDYLSDDSALEKEKSILQAQSVVVSSIENKTKTEVTPDAVYTLLFNGFAIKSSYSDMEKIKEIEGVKNVYISEDIRLEPCLDVSGDLISASSGKLEGYTGRKQVVAVIDTEFDVYHPFFTALPENPRFKSADDVSKYLGDTALSMPITINGAFISQKIPFAYDYGENDYNLSHGEKDKIHGTHVAGTIGGKNGTYNNSVINGIAPDSQLVLMKATDSNGILQTASVFSAMQDAVRLGVSVINCSLTAYFESPDANLLWNQNVTNAISSGIQVVSAAGNYGRGFYRQSISTDNIDYSSIGTPASLSAGISVGAARKQTAATSQIASFSGYGVTENLELSPEITAPGISIYSSYPGKAYAGANGTSQATPLVSGVIALMNEYFDENMPATEDEERNALIKNMIMSTADVLKQSSNGVPFTPRVQGAGMINADAALKTPVILLNDSGETKINLGDDLSDEISIKFTAKNLTENTVTYDKLTLNMLTDGYSRSGEKTYVGESVALEVVSHNLPLPLTLEKKEEKLIEAKIKLNEEWLTENLNIFRNGFFIDGFISYETEGGSLPHIGIPIVGFYDDWTKATVFDTTVYDAGGSKLVDSTQQAFPSLLYSLQTGDILGFCGGNEYDSKYIAISPNNDGAHDSFGFQFTPMRTISRIESSVTDENGRMFKGPVYNQIFNKFRAKAINLNDMTSFSDGEYTLNLTAYYNYEKDNPTVHTKEIPFYVDRVVPQITKIAQNGNTLNITVKDDKYISRVYLYYNSKYSEVKFVKNTAEGEETTLSFDLSEIGARDASHEDIYVYVHDMANNYYANTLSCLTGDIHPFVSDFTYLKGIYSMTVDVVSYKNEQDYAIIAAFYSDDGELIHINIKDGTSLPKGSSTIEFKDIAELDGAKNCKLFFWDDMNKIKPADTVKSVKVS